jgi:hypothetical protein
MGNGSNVRRPRTSAYLGLLCKRFASVSPGASGHRYQTDRAPMLVGTRARVELRRGNCEGPVGDSQRPVSLAHPEYLG